MPDAFAQGPHVAAPSPAASLEDRDRTVLQELAREMDAWVSFQGLRRQLRVHQQALSRTLRRLQRDGLVAHDGKGYQLTDRGAEALHGATPLRDEDGRDASATPVTILEAMLPPHASPGDVAAQLARRWFGGLRWFGQSDGPGETTLHWLTEPGGARVTLRLAPGSLALEVVPDAADPGRGLAAVRPVLSALAEVYGLGAGGSAAAGGASAATDPLHGYRGAKGFVA